MEGREAMRAAAKYAEIEGVGIGRVVAVFMDGAWARDHLACWACDGHEPMRGFDPQETPMEDGRVLLLEMGDRTRAMVAESDAREATAIEWEHAKGLPMPPWSPDVLPQIIGRSRQCRTCDGSGECPRCSTPRKCNRCEGRGITLDPDGPQQVLPLG